MQPTNVRLLTPCRNLFVASSRSWNSSYLTRATIEHLNVLGRRYSGETLTVHELEQRVLNVLKAFDKVNPEKVTVEAHFVNDLGMDSLDSVEVVMAFEDEFGVEISDEEAEKIFTCKDAIELLKSKLHLK
ncbi:hypothetical protein EMCRGX_G028580 [Ephydatia muelleri]